MLTVKRSALCRNDLLEPANRQSSVRTRAATEKRNVRRDESLMCMLAEVSSVAPSRRCVVCLAGVVGVEEYSKEFEVEKMKWTKVWAGFAYSNRRQ